MKRWIVATLVVGVIGRLAAAGLCDPCWSSGVEAIGDFLYIRPSLCDLNYVIIDDRSFGPAQATEIPALLPSGSKRGQSPGYDAAFRIGGAYVFNDGCNDLAVTYTGLWDRSKKSVELPQGSELGLWATFGHPRYMSSRLNDRVIGGGGQSDFNASATDNLRIAYSMIDGTMAVRQMEVCNLLIRRYIGVRWTDINVRRTALYFGTTTNGEVFFNEEHEVNHNTHVWGIGPRIGADLRWGLICGFGVGAHMGASILVGEGDIVLNQHDEITQFGQADPITNQILDMREHLRTRLMPEFDMRLGFNYLWCCGRCLSLLVEAGYQFDSYINAVTDFRFNDEGGTGRAVCQSFNLDGFYVHFEVAL